MATALPTNTDDSPNYDSDAHAAHHNELHGGHNGVTANRQTANYVLVLADLNKVVEMNVGSANTLTVPPNSSVAFAVGTCIEFVQWGAGQTTITPGSGVTLRSSGGKLKTSAQYAAGVLRKVATDEWHVAGELST